MSSSSPRQNPAFIGDDGRSTASTVELSAQQPSKDVESTNNPTPSKTLATSANEEARNGRDTWGKGIEFLMSCIAMSVGLGNVWRFPFTALDNGGGAFLIPYLIVLFLVGKPIYYLEMIIGQFSSRGSVKVFDLCPAMKGVGIGQVISISLVTTYYVAIMGITLRYLYDSFRDPLPWSECRADWEAQCVASSAVNTAKVLHASNIIAANYTIGNQSSYYAIDSDLQQRHQQPIASAELYFLIFITGVGIGQALMVFILGTYYEALCAIIGYYFVESFRDPLPWAYCRPEWSTNCFNSAPSIETANTTTTKNIKSIYNNNNVTSSNYNFNNNNNNISTNNWLNGTTFAQNSNSAERLISSSEWFFVKAVLREKDNIKDGIGAPNWELVIGLFVSWMCVFLIIRRGVKSSGKASYFLALFPYVIMGVLLVRAVTLPGAADGILYFIKPNWGKILDPKVWYAAVTQCFYSLSVCFGNIIMYSSFNKFNHNVHRDATIVTALDTATSLLAGFTIFGILGHLAHEIGTDDIGTVVKNGAGLAFISYPDAIAKFKNLPQIFSVLFFLMLFILGIGSNIAMTSCSVTALRDRFPQIKQWQASLALAVISFAIGLMYITPGGQYMLTLIDFFGASMIALVLGILELYVIGWVYGTDRLCKDVEFMLGRKVGLYWRLCWSIITPAIMTMILIYFYATFEPLTYNNMEYPTWANAIGWCITALGIIQVPIWVIVAIIREPGDSLGAKVRGAFRPKKHWGPSDPLLREQYYKEIENELRSKKGLGFWDSIKQNITG